MNHHIFATLVVIVKLVSVSGQETTTEDNHHTVTYNPGVDCLPYDGSVVPDCRKYVDPITKQPFFKEHSANCSRFWMCGPDGETCLVECAHCGGPSNSLCNGQWALTFDPSYQYPLGPVCDWPSNIECGVVCNLEEHECCENADCNKCPDGYCTMAFTCQYDGVCECSQDSECDNFDGVCNVPAPHEESACSFCDGGLCVGGCSAVGGDSVNCPDSHPTCSSDHVCGCGDSMECDMFDGVCDMQDPSDPYGGHCYYCDAAASQCKPGCGGLENNANCPDNYECNQASHECELSVCTDHPFCDGYDEVCNGQHDNCFFCGGDCGSDNGCCQGCHDSGMNCAYPAPVCDDVTHTCGCKEDGDCNAEDWCNTDIGLCEPDCQDHDQCLGYDEVCNAQHDNCFFCGGDCGSNDGCCQGCHDDELNCVYPTPVCDQSSHTCGCNDDGDCDVEDFCNTDTNTCEPQCVQDTECVGFDQVCNDAYDNCFFCGDCDGFGCCPGCHDSDMNCVYPKPICQTDHKCGCNTDDDCKPGDQCDGDTNSCVAIPDECTTDADCNTDAVSGVCEAAVAEQTQCFYCDNSGLYNVCKPGCMFDSDSSEVPRCPVQEPVCNIDTHFCQAQTGSTLLMGIVFTSSKCDGCVKEGVNLTLTGSDNLLPAPLCRTVDLDHPDKADYVSRSEFLAQPAEQNMGWDSCYQRGMEGEIIDATATWTGEGTWSPDSICFDWDKEANRVSVCTFPEGTSLSHGQSVSLTCAKGDTVECP